MSNLFSRYGNYYINAVWGPHQYPLASQSFGPLISPVCLWRWFKLPKCVLSCATGSRHFVEKKKKYYSLQSPTVMHWEMTNCVDFLSSQSHLLFIWSMTPTSFLIFLILSWISTSSQKLLQRVNVRRSLHVTAKGINVWKVKSKSTLQIYMNEHCACFVHLQLLQNKYTTSKRESLMLL